jgi:hypothetical protein
VTRRVPWDAGRKDDDLSFRVSLARAATVEGVVRGPDGKPLPHGWVGLTSDPEAWEPDDLAPQTVLDGEGRFRLTDVDPLTTSWLVVNAEGTTMRPVALRDRLRVDRPLVLDVATVASTRFLLSVTVDRPLEGLLVQMDDGPRLPPTEASVSIPAWTGHHRVRLLDGTGAILAERRFDVGPEVERHAVTLR